MKILNFGSLNIDNCYFVNNFVQPGETTESLYFEEHPGGKGLNQSIAAVRAGGEVYHAGLYGSKGEMLKQYLRDNGVDVSYLKETNHIQGHAVIQIDKNGENCIIVHGGSNYQVTEEYIDDVINDFDENTYIVLQNEISNVSYIISKAKEKGMKVIINPSPINDEVLKIDYNKVDWLLVNKIESMEISKKDTVDDALDYFEKSFPNLGVVQTLGSEGSICTIGKKRIFQESYKTEVVDTTGAGDTFTGYFISGLCQNINLEENLRRASKASSICVSKKGAAPAIPKLEDLYL